MPRTPTHPACFLLVHGYLLQRFRHVTAPFRRMLSRSCALVVLGLSLGSTPLRAGLTVDLHTYRGQWGFVTYGWLSTNALSPAPAFGHYLIRSPHYPTNGSVLQYEMGAAGLTFLWGSGAGVSTFNEFMVGLTNGPWTIQFTNNTTTNVYTFTVTATGLSSNLLRPPIITYPQDGDPDVPSNPTFTWTEGPIGWHGTLEVELYGSQFNFNQFDSLSPTQTNWTSPVPLPPENYNFHVTYRSNATPTIVASTPLDGAMNPLGGWVSTANIEVSDSTYFTVAPPGSPVGQVGLIAHYRFDNAMNLGLDSSTNGFDLNVGGAWNNGTVGYDTNAVAGPGAALFSAPDTASGAFLSWNPTPAAILSTLASNFSVSVWIKTTLLILPSDSPPAEMGIVTADVLGVTNDVTPVALGAGQVAFNTGGDADHTTYSSSGVADGVYHHVVVTRDALNGRKRIYVNGVLEASEFGQTGLLNAPQLAALGAFLDASESNPAAATPGNGYDGWLDDVQIYAGILSSNQVAFLYAHPGQVAPSETNPPVEVELELSITRHRSHDLSEGYICFPTLLAVSPPAVTQHAVKSPTEKFTGTENSASSLILGSLAEVIEECTNGLWKLYINEGHPSERVFTFSVTITNLSTNLLAPVTILSPANGSVNVPTNAALAWSGPTGFNGVFAQTYRLPYTNVVSTNMPGTATNWPAPPPLNPGTNRLYVNFYSNNYPHVSFTLPVDTNNLPLAAWSTIVHLNSRATSEFVVSTGPTPVQLINPLRVGTNFQFQFLSQPGRSNLVQSRTNLTVGTWVNRTSILGDGTIKTVVLPMSGRPMEFFRILTQ